MTVNLRVGDIFPDFELPDHRKRPRRLSGYTLPSPLDERLGFDDGYPLILVFGRGFFCPRDQEQMRGLIRFQSELAVNYCKLVTVSADPTMVGSKLPRALASLVERSSSLRSVGRRSEGSRRVCSLAPELPLLFHTPHGLSLAHRGKKVESKSRTWRRISGALLLLLLLRLPVSWRARRNTEQSSLSKHSAGREVEERAS